MFHQLKVLIQGKETWRGCFKLGALQESPSWAGTTSTPQGCQSEANAPVPGNISAWRPLQALTLTACNGSTHCSGNLSSSASGGSQPVQEILPQGHWQICSPLWHSCHVSIWKGTQDGTHVFCVKNLRAQDGPLKTEAQLQDQWNIRVFTRSLSPDQRRRYYRLQQFHFNIQFAKRLELPQSSVSLPAHLCFLLFPSHLLPDLQCSLPSLPSETKQTESYDRMFNNNKMEIFTDWLIELDVKGGGKRDGATEQWSCHCTQKPAHSNSQKEAQWNTDKLNLLNKRGFWLANICSTFQTSCFIIMGLVGITVKHDFIM